MIAPRSSLTVAVADGHRKRNDRPGQIKRWWLPSLLRVGVLAGLIGAGGLSPANSQPAAGEGPGAPRPDEPAVSAEALTRDGGCTVRSYALTLPHGAIYAGGTVYYPGDGHPPFGGVVVCPGFREDQAETGWLGPRLASHGFVVLTMDVKGKRSMPQTRSGQLLAALQTLRAEGTQPNRPLARKLDLQRLAVVGHSMGGGAALIVAEALGPGIKAALALNPWCKEPKAFPTVTVPTLVIAGENDLLAPASHHARVFYASLPASTPKLYLEVKGGHHGMTNGAADGTFSGLTRIEGAPTEAQRRIISRYVIAWLKLYVDGDQRYRLFISAALSPQDAALVSRIEMAP